MFVGVFVFQIFGYVIGSLFGDTGELSATIGSSIGAACGIVALGGVSLIRPDLQAVVLAFKKGWWAILVAAALFVFGIIESFVLTSGEVVPGWPLRILWLCTLCAAIGFSEEGMFRGILLGGVLDVCGKNLQGIIMAAGISALLFGVAHVEWWSMNWLDPLQVIQAVLKMIQTGTLGFFFAALVVKGESIWGVAILHGLSDLLIMIPSIGLLGESANVSYVNSGEEAIGTIFLYLIVIAVYLPLVWSGVKMLREVPVPDRGAFHKEPR
jgi:membrane protease YdiL (CAAX protease family)